MVRAFKMFLISQKIFYIYSCSCLSKGDVQLLWNQFSELHEPQVFKSQEELICLLELGFHLLSLLQQL